MASRGCIPQQTRLMAPDGLGGSRAEFRGVRLNRDEPQAPNPVTQRGDGDCVTLFITWVRSWEKARPLPEPRDAFHVRIGLNKSDITTRIILARGLKKLPGDSTLPRLALPISIAANIRTRVLPSTLIWGLAGRAPRGGRAHLRSGKPSHTMTAP